MSFQPIKIIDVELSTPLFDIRELSGYSAIRALVRLHGTPLGIIELPFVGGGYTAAALGQAIVDHLDWSIARHLLHDALAAGGLPGGIPSASLLDVAHFCNRAPQPMITIAVCTRDRTPDLDRCLAALERMEYANYEILVVDNAPSDMATKQLVRERYPSVRYTCESRPGLDWARNRAIDAARGEIIAFTDDDVIADPGWLRVLAPLFAENPEVMAVTGLVIPYALDTPAEELFERYGGFGRGFERKWYRLRTAGERQPAYHIGAGILGTGANMAFRRDLFARIGQFDPALDVGTVTNGGGDLEMFFRVLVEGYTLVYEPAAFVRHCHRREYARLHAQIANNGIGFFAFLTRSAWAYPRERLAIIRLALWWLWWWDLRRLLISFYQPNSFPRELILAELRGSLIGPLRYWQAHRTARRMQPPARPKSGSAIASGVPSRPAAIRPIDLSRPLRVPADLSDYYRVFLVVSWHEIVLGQVEIVHQGQPLGIDRVRQAVVDQLMLRLLEPGLAGDSTAAWDALRAALAQRYSAGAAVVAVAPQPALESKLPADVSVSIVVATRDRPDDLRACLAGLSAQHTSRPVEIIVVDNHPASSQTAALIEEFPKLRWLAEPRAGLSYARNAGIAASCGAIVVTTDDDVVIPPSWLEQLIAPLADEAVMVVTGNVLPLEIETPAQQLFELYGGLGRGFERKVYTGAWFAHFRRHAVPTWQIGATANAAFRATIFTHPAIGMLDEALGAGMPTGCSEDTDLFYRVLKAGYSIVYEPNALLWHRHRRSMAALRRQIYSYSKGHVAYHLVTLLRDSDLRALHRLVIELPRAHLWRIKRWLRRRSQYPPQLIGLEVLGNLAGPLALWRARRAVRRAGPSVPYQPRNQLS